MLGALTVLLLFQCVGEGVSYGLSLPVPGPVVGMVLLFVFLLIRPSAIAMVEPSADLLLKHLSLLFVPAGVGVMAFGTQVHGEWLAIVVALFASTLLAIAVTALVTRALMRVTGHDDLPPPARKSQKSQGEAGLPPS
jgi:holin-like protein